MRYPKSGLLQRLLIQVVSHTDSSRNDKIHFEHFLFLIEYNIFFLWVTEAARLQTKCNVVKEFTFFVFLWIEENPEIVKNIIEQIMYDNPSFNAIWKSIYKLIILLYLTQSIICPVVTAMMINLTV